MGSRSITVTLTEDDWQIVHAALKAEGGRLLQANDLAGWMRWSTARSKLFCAWEAEGDDPRTADDIEADADDLRPSLATEHLGTPGAL